MPCDPAIILLGVYLKETKPLIRNHTCTPVLTAALATPAKTWKQPRCPSTEDWIKKMWYIHTMEYYSATKKDSNSAICSNMTDLEDMLSEKYYANKRKTKTV